MFYGGRALAVQFLSIKCLVLYRAGRIYSMKSLVLYRAGSQMLCFTVFLLLGPLKRYVLRCSCSRGANFIDKMPSPVSRGVDLLDEMPSPLSLFSGEAQTNAMFYDVLRLGL